MIQHVRRPRAAVVTVAWVCVLCGLGAVPEDRGPVPWRVYQGGPDGTGRIPMPRQGSGATPRLVDGSGAPVPGVVAGPDALESVPVGGPYHVELGDAPDRKVGPIFVGDLWVLAGQSNMEGRNDQKGAIPPHPRVALLGLDGQWRQASDPLHRHAVAVDPVQVVTDSPDSDLKQDQGSGPGMAFATTLAERVGVPIGLIASAKAATPLRKWDSSGRSEGSRSLYGAMLAQIERAGGKVRGVLWYQGEADAMGHPYWGEESARYAARLEALIGAIRRDLGEPKLPFYLVQLGPHIDVRSDPKGWTGVRAAQLAVADRLENVGLVSAVDMDMHNKIHLDSASEAIVGRRLAMAVAHGVYGREGGTTPRPVGVERTGRTLRVRFRGVNRDGSIGLQGPRKLTGFSIRRPDQTDYPLIMKASVDPEDPETVVIRLGGALPEWLFLWYGWGSDPKGGLTDALGMAVPAFGPIPLKGQPGMKPVPQAAGRYAIGAAGAALGGGAVGLLWLVRHLRRTRRGAADASTRSHAGAGHLATSPVN